MKGKKLFLFSLILAIAAAGAVYMYLSDLETQSKAASDLVPVYVVAAEIPARTKLEPAMFKTMDMPKTAIHQDAVTDLNQISGAYAKDRLLAGEQVLASRLVLTKSENGLSYKVSAGHRAVTIPVNNVSGVAGFILPGDAVDCIVTIDLPDSDNKDVVTKLVAENVRVLAVGPFVFEQEKQQLLVDTVTLDAPVDAVSVIIQASERGSLRFVLRPANDTIPGSVTAFRISQF